MRSLMILTQYCAGGKIKKNEMGWALHGRSQRVTIPDAVKYNFDLLKMSIVLLETCRGI
jgi:hypothetical protein